MEWPWIRLKRLIGASGTPSDTQEGQIRYTRDGAVDGAFKVARKLSGGTNEWQDLSTGVANAAPKDAKYIVQQTNATLTNEQALGALSTGILKSTTTTGVLSIAAQGMDYYAPGGTDVAVADGGTGASDAAGARTNLGVAATSHTHAESDVTSLVADLGTLTTAVAGKAATVHTHAEADVTSLVADLAGKAATSHTHAEADVTSLVADLALKSPLASPTFTGTVTTAALIANGDVAIGDAQSDTATFTAHLAVAGADPTITTTPAASYPGSGTTPGAVTINGNDTAMLITYSTGTGATAGDMFKVAFATARPGSAYVVLVQCMNNGSSQVQPYITGRSTTDFTVVAKVAPPSSTSIQFGILVIDV